MKYASGEEWSRLRKRDFGDCQFTPHPEHDVFPLEPPDEPLEQELDFTNLKMPIPDENYERTEWELDHLRRLEEWRERREILKRKRPPKGKYIGHPSTRRNVVAQNIRAGRESGVLDLEQWERWCACFDGCAYCGRKTEGICIEHVIPLSRDGANTIYNIVPSCHGCNWGKGCRSPDQFKRPAMFDEFVQRVIGALEKLEAPPD